MPGCAALTAAKIVGETAAIGRFKSAAAYARHNGTAPLPAWSSKRARHRLSRTGNRQLNAALHRIAITQARCHPPAQQLIAHRKAGGDGGMEARRILKRRLSDVIYQALHANTQQQTTAASPTSMVKGEQLQDLPDALGAGPVSVQNPASYSFGQQVPQAEDR
ncbi:IS110 family transposase [Actinoplanes sp. NEAU-A12]|uniref:IS110 family transposase n=1 Tax=Actinoplanes sandaracinus TaxID=3045177 RepID=A0ABT6WSN9_9ACTN|nr:IS110 family transposase [Actinoplanes sandaracinus]